jgi:hypothetical protein
MPNFLPDIIPITTKKLFKGPNINELRITKNRQHFESSAVQKPPPPRRRRLPPAPASSGGEDWPPETAAGPVAMTMFKMYKMFCSMDKVGSMAEPRRETL